MISRPRVLVVADVPQWAWGRKAAAYARHLSDDFAVVVAYQTDGLPHDLSRFELIHLFEFPQTNFISPEYRARGGKVVTGCTANVWRTWGAERVRAWADRADGVHANSCLLVDDLRANVFAEEHERPVWYCPNGVDAEYWRRTEPHPATLVAGHVGKPNPRKGAELILIACRRAGVPCKIVQRTAKLALSAEEMRAWYQGVSLQVTASNMDATPNPCLESAACSNALLSTPIGNMIEFIEPGVNGKLVPPYFGPPVDLPENSLCLEGLCAELDWCKNHYDDVLAMGAAARKTVEAEWRWGQQVRHVKRMWESVLA